MFAKIFTQIFDSSIAEHYQARHVFMDLLVLADSDGCVDMTTEAIARRTNVPLDVVRGALEQLCQPDPSSRTHGEDGRRLLPLDAARPWGWQIVNYAHYRAIRDEEARREYHRDYRRKEREDKRAKQAKRKASKVDGGKGFHHPPVFTRKGAALVGHQVIREEDEQYPTDPQV